MRFRLPTKIWIYSSRLNIFINSGKLIQGIIARLYKSFNIESLIPITEAFIQCLITYYCVFISGHIIISFKDNHNYLI